MKYPLKTSIFFIVMLSLMLIIWFSPYDMLYPQIVPLHWIPEIIGLFIIGIYMQQFHYPLKIVFTYYFGSLFLTLAIIGDIYEFKVGIFLLNFMLLGYFTHYYYTNTKTLNRKTNTKKEVIEK